MFIVYSGRGNLQRWMQSFHLVASKTGGPYSQSNSWGSDTLVPPPKIEAYG